MGSVINYADEQAIQPDYPENIDVIDNNLESITLSMKPINKDVMEIYILSPDQVESLFQGKVIILGGCSLMVMEGFE